MVVKVRQRGLVILSAFASLSMNSAKNLVFLRGGKTLRGVYPEPKTEILRSAQDDSRRRAQDDRRRNQDDSLGLLRGYLFGFKEHAYSPIQMIEMNPKTG